MVVVGKKFALISRRVGPSSRRLPRMFDTEAARSLAVFYAVSGAQSLAVGQKHKAKICLRKL